MDIAKLLEAIAPPVRKLGQGLLGISLAGVGADILKDGAVSWEKIAALTFLGVLLWMLANLADPPNKTKNKGKKKGKRR